MISNVFFCLGEGDPLRFKTLVVPAHRLPVPEFNQEHQESWSWPCYGRGAHLARRMYRDLSLTQLPPGVCPMHWTQFIGPLLALLFFFALFSSHFVTSTAVEAYRQVMQLLDANSTNARQKKRMVELLREWGPRYNV